MGIFFKLSKDSYPCKDNSSSQANQAIDHKNPDPSKYVINLVEKINDFLIVCIDYPNCWNYEGKKILVYYKVELFQLENQKLIDPHFSDNPTYCSPVARFVPTAEGLNMARNFAMNYVNP